MEVGSCQQYKLVAVNDNIVVIIIMIIIILLLLLRLLQLLIFSPTVAYDYYVSHDPYITAIFHYFYCSSLLLLLLAPSYPPIRAPGNDDEIHLVCAGAVREVWHRRHDRRVVDHGLKARKAPITRGGICGSVKEYHATIDQKWGLEIDSQEARRCFESLAT